jgi:hypothetical protein
VKNGFFERMKKDGKPSLEEMLHDVDAEILGQGEGNI